MVKNKWINKNNILENIVYRIAEDKDDNISIKKNDKNDKLKENETVLSDSSEVKVFVLTPEEKKAISNSKKGIVHLLQ